MPENKENPQILGENIMPENARAVREHNPALGQVWAALTGRNPESILSQVTATVLQDGGTRPPWKWALKGMDYTALAWPQDQPIRACVLLKGEPGEKMRPVSVFPLLEGLPNDLTVEEVRPFEEGEGANVGALMLEGKNPMWFFDPFYTRDKSDLTPGVTHTFWLAAAALALRRAMLDEITLASGPDFELHAQKWLAENPGAKSMDAPPLKINIAGKRFIMPGRFFGEYQIRAEVDDVEDWLFDKTPVRVLYLTFPFDGRPALRLPVYVSEFASRGYKAEKGQEVEAYVWLQGRIIDLEDPGAAAESDGR